MSTIKYKLTINSFTSRTPCEGFYVHTGITHNIELSSPINGIETLIPISSGTTFNIDVSSEYQFIYLFIIHCDGYDTSENLQGGYQVSIVDLRCTDCFKGNCLFDVVIEIIP